MNLEELKVLIDKNKELCSVLPENTILNRKKKKEYLKKELETFQNMEQDILAEIKKRYSKIEEFKENKEIPILKEEEKKLTLFKEWNPYNTPYEKMHLDYYLYHLHRYYKDDLKSVNVCLYSLLESFQKVGITLTKDDFIYHTSAMEYMDVVINHKEDEKIIQETFESLYWKCPNIITILEVNFKYLYYKNLKKIEKYYVDRFEKVTSNHQAEQILESYYNTIAKRKALEAVDEYTILQKFIKNRVNVTDLNQFNVDKKKKRFFENLPTDMLSILEKLLSSLEEYEYYMNYEFIVNDMRNRLSNKDQYKGKMEAKLKEIEKEEKTLFQLNETQKKKNKSFFNKKKKDEKNIFKIQEIFSHLETFYAELDDIKYNELIYNKLSVDISISDALKMVSSNYLYFVAILKENDATKNIKEITKKHQDLAYFMNSFSFTLLNNIHLLEEKNISEIISNRYKLLSVSLEISDLEVNNLKNMKDDINDLIFADNLTKTKLNVEDIEFYLEMKKLKILE